jgi:hypothetical protein
MTEFIVAKVIEYCSKINEFTIAVKKMADMITKMIKLTITKHTIPE